MKVVICPDKFKGSATAQEVAQAITKGIKRYDQTIETIIHPLADGGEGSIDIIDAHLRLDEIILTVKDPLGRNIKATYKRRNKAAFIEMSKASGLNLIDPSDYQIMKSSSYGTGQLILHAIENECSEIYLFIGGSATNDGGIGMASALGYKFKDSDGNELKPSGENLINISSIDYKSVSSKLNSTQFYTVCDVTNPLFGPNGAAYTFGKQKGANSHQIYVLDQGLTNLSKIIKNDIGIDISEVPGSGAAGGIGGGSMAFLRSQLISGIQSIMDITGFHSIAIDADLLITGEGKSDHQSLHGKVISGVASYGNKMKIAVGIIVGQNELNDSEMADLKLAFARDTMSKAKSIGESSTNVKQFLEDLAYDAIKKFCTE